MDTQKDNNIESVKNTSVAMSDKNTDIISFFNVDEQFVFLFKKTEKLTTALYLVTNLFSDEEPLKWVIRKKVSELLSFTIAHKDIPVSRQLAFIEDAKTRILDIVSLLEICSRSGLISHMNFSIIQEEFSRLVYTLESSALRENSPAHTMLSQDFFAVKNTHFVSREPIKDVYQKDAIFSDSLSRVNEKKEEVYIKDKSILSDNLVFKKTNRQNIIIQLLKKKKDLTIKDIALVIKDCSEKTIQRELISLIHSGLLKKTGERRWSKYSLVSETI